MVHPRVQYGFSTSKFVSQAEHCRDYLRPTLVELRDQIHCSPEVFDKKIKSTNQRRLGIRLWVFPPPYYQMIRKEQWLRLALVDVFANVKHWPSYKMVCVGHVPIEGQDDLYQGSPIAWSVGKGNVSNVALTYNWRDVSTEWRIAIHSEDWPVGIESMDKHDFRAVPGTIRRGLSRSDFKSLRERYGSAVFIPLRAGGLQHPIGTLTVHAPSKHPLDSDQARAIATLLTEKSPGKHRSIAESLARTVVTRTTYP